MTELRIGAIIEVRTTSGLAYAHYTHHHPSYGEVVRLLPGLHPTRPEDFRPLLDARGATHLLLPLKQALRREDSLIAVVGWEPLQAVEQVFPVFRMAIRDRHGDIAYWWLWDGSKVWQKTELSQDEQQLPFRAISSVEQLVAHLQEAAVPASG